jgi:hypothetical protein
MILKRGRVLLMFCPRCNAEYREGFTLCSDCKVPLVQEPPEEDLQKTKEKFIEYEEVLFTFNPADIAFIKSVLDSEDIAYYFHGEHFALIRPFVEPARLMVEKESVAAVKEWLKDTKLSIMGINLDEHEEA